MNTSCTHLKIPYDVCASYIARNMRKDLIIHLVSYKRPDVISTISLENMKGLNIQEMKENDCGKNECLEGYLKYEGKTYNFKTHHYAYDAVLCMKNKDDPYDKIKIVLPITTYKERYDDRKIYIPEEFTKDIKIVPIEFVWEFLTQLPSLLKDIDEIYLP